MSGKCKLGPKPLIFQSRSASEGKRTRRGPKKAIMAVAASILTAIYHMLKDGTMYKDLGRDHFDRRSKVQQKQRLVKRLADLGYAVEIKPLAA